MLAILLIPASLCYTFGRMVNDTRQGWAILATMLVIFLPLLVATYVAEQTGNPKLAGSSIDQVRSTDQVGGNMEGKEVRFGIANSALWAVATTAASNGSVNGHHRGLQRLRERHARQLHSAWRDDPNVADPTRRNHLRRRG